MDDINPSNYDIDEGGIFVTDIHLQGGSWSYDNDCLEDAKYVYLVESF